MDAVRTSKTQAVKAAVLGEKLHAKSIDEPMSEEDLGADIGA